ncbi:MAG: cellulase family glycosylhydrolase [Acidobacteria bacterium]|nr:cellulase family glycosylhydrolase [Acidobacteriota bacterium]
MTGLRAVLLTLAITTSSIHSFAADTKPAIQHTDPSTIHGAVYVPINAWNAPQMWKNFSLAETRRDFGYAQKLHVNALRLWASYEFWQKEPAKFKHEFDQLLHAANEAHIRILVSLFENDGVAGTPENLSATGPAMGFAIVSPAVEISTDKSKWGQPRAFVRWFMQNYRSDPRLLAIEIMNEPNPGRGGKPNTVPFAQAMLQAAKSLQGTVPLTMGTDHLDIAQQFVPYGLDIVEIHNNFPKSTQQLQKQIEEALAFGKKHNLPVWLTEWQRVRPSGSGWGDQKLTKEELDIDYASMAATVHKYPIGNFFWSLMVKPSYLVPQRRKGTVSGIFWPDGSVWKLKDARAVADDPTLTLKEKPLPANYRNYVQPQPK